MILLIILITVFLLIFKLRRSHATPPQIQPPTHDVELFGCSGIAECGFWSPESIVHDDGTIELNNKVCCCSYQHKKIPYGSPCPFAEDHPELVRKGFIL